MQMNRSPEELVRLGEQRSELLKANDLPAVLTAKQAGPLLGVGERTACALAAKGELPATNDNGRWRFDRDGCIKYAREHFGEKTGLFDNCILGKNARKSAEEIPREFTIRRVGRDFA